MKIAPLIGFPGRILTGTTIRKNLSDAGTHLGTLSAIEAAFDPDIIFYMMDLSVEADSLGIRVDFPDEKSPTVIEHPVASEDDLPRFRKADFLNGRTRVFIDVVKGFKKASKKDLGAYVIAPFTLCGLLLGPKRAASCVITRPAFIEKVLELSTELIVAYARELKQSGADYVVLLDPTSVILSPAQFNRYASPYINAITDITGNSCVLHICGNTSHLFDELGRLKKIMGVSLDSAVDLKEAYRKTKKTVIGNISPKAVAHGSINEIDEAVEALMQNMKGIDDFIFSTGCDLPPETPISRIHYLMRCVKKYA
ncbi:MAG: uroporphyrinogen decarboxylase family protein [Proteobacteria bacterium]|nr:uroporphyrinogen decarboxylase family protein [Pseudomonadota bacterium]